MNLALWVDGIYCRDGIFEPHGPANRDDCAAGFRALKEAVERDGGRFHTIDVYDHIGETPDVILFLEVPAAPVRSLVRRYPGAVPWVILFESEVVTPRNWARSRHVEFEKIFTWDDTIIDRQRYIKINFPNRFPEELPRDQSSRTLFATMIAANKTSPHPNELYSARVATIQWYERNDPDSFHLYGGGWDARAGSRGLRAKVERAAARARLMKPFPSWRGRVERKLDVLRQYQFAFCYENARGYPGYITEKLFDCIAAGTVPVYWGPPNATSHLDSGSYIDREAFASEDELHDYMSALSDAERQEIVDNGSRFLSCGHADPFGCDAFSGTIMQALRQQAAVDAEVFVAAT